MEKRNKKVQGKESVVKNLDEKFRRLDQLNQVMNNWKGNIINLTDKSYTDFLGNLL